VNLHHPPAGTIRASRKRRLMYAHQDRDSTSAVSLSVLGHRSRAAVRAPDPQHCGAVAPAAGGARLLMPRWLAGLRRVAGLALAAGWAATLAAVIVGSHLSRGTATQIIFAAVMSTAALGEMLFGPAAQVIIEDRAAPGAAGRSRRLGTVAVVTGCLLGPLACGAALGADWGTSLLTTLAVACALASMAAHRLVRPARSGMSGAADV
jgi:hypothetical protein